MGLFDFLGLGKRKAMIEEAIKNGALIIDVRSAAEYQGGHVEGSKNIPLNTIPNRLQELKSKGKAIVFCCASGARSGMATGQAKSAGIEAYNGGGWLSLNGLLQSA